MTSLVSKVRQSRELLRHILDTPELPAVIQRLDAEVLTKLIRHVGLEDSAEIVSLATAEQLKGVLDEDLWHSKAPGLDETFDSERFGLWLEIMMESGSAFAACKVMELDEDLVALGLCGLVLVLDLHDPILRFGRDEYTDDPIVEKALDGSLNMEFDRYLVISKNESSWDAICALMAALNELDYETMVRLLNRCCWASGEEIEENGGLYHVLTDGEMLEEDVSSERKERREKKGFVTPTSAAVFLSQARSTALTEIVAAETIDPITGAYFRAIESEAESADRSRRGDETSEKGSSGSIQTKVVQLAQTIQDADELPTSDQQLLGYDGAGSWDHLLPLARAMEAINQTDPNLFSQRLREFSYLSNTLISGCKFQGRAFRPKEAAEAAFSACNLGSEYLLLKDAKSESDRSVDLFTDLLKVHHLVKLFQVGWKILFENVALHTAKRVLEFIHQQKGGMKDPQQTREMARLIHLLRSCISSGRPWDFQDQMDDLQVFLDGGTTAAITALMQPYPTLSEVICKKEGHWLFPFIWSQAHIETIEYFIRNAL